jgi:hypothetical protein
MKTVRRAAILKLASAAYEMELDVLNGRLVQDEGERWFINERPLNEWLNSHAGQEVVMVLGSLEDERPVETRTCRTCGRDYTELECPHCRASRIRLRGRA